MFVIINKCQQNMEGMVEKVWEVKYQDQVHHQEVHHQDQALHQDQVLL